MEMPERLRWVGWHGPNFSAILTAKNGPNIVSGESFSENLFTDMADILVRQGYRDAGYTRVNVDDCWGTRERDPQSGVLLADPVRFPHGMKWLASYMHENGLQMGIYSNNGPKTCMGFAGTTMKDMERDAKTFAEWGADMLKLDGCFVDTKDFPHSYPLMGKQLNATGRKFLYSCSWPFYIRTVVKQKPDYNLIMKTCHTWRNFDDIQLSWGSVKRIIDFYDENQEELAQYHGPGHWNDPDMLIVGNRELTIDQARVQMGLWCIWSAPLLMSNDLREMEEPYRAILLNPHLIAVNQDPLGIMGRKVAQKGRIAIYLKPMTPVVDSGDGKEYSYAIAFFNQDVASLIEIDIYLRELGLARSGLGYLTEDLFTGENYGLIDLDTVIHLKINPTGIVMWKATVASAMRKRISEQFTSSSPTLYAILTLLVLAIVCMTNRRKLRGLFRLFYRKR